MGDIAAVAGRHLLHLLQRAPLFGQLFAQAQGGLQRLAALKGWLQVGKLQLTFANQIADAVQRDAAVIADDPSAAIAVRQPGQHPRLATAQHIRGIDVKYPLIVGLAQRRKLILKGGIHFAAIGLEGAFDHIDAAKRMQGALQRLVRLQADDLFQRLVDIARRVGGDGGGDIGVEIHRRMGGVLDADPGHHLLPEGGGRWRRVGEERLIALVRGVVMLNKVADVDLRLPRRTAKALPGVGVSYILGIDIYFHEHRLSTE